MRTFCAASVFFRARSPLRMKTAAAVMLAILVTGAAMSTVRLKYFNVDREGNALAVTWETETEDDVRSFEVFRKAGFDAGFVPVGTSNGHGIDRQYKILDDQVYKAGSSAFIDYRLEVVYNSGVRQRLAEKKVNYTSTAIRRSWGSIKAMFQD